MVLTLRKRHSRAFRRGSKSRPPPDNRNGGGEGNLIDPIASTSENGGGGDPSVSPWPNVNPWTDEPRQRPGSHGRTMSEPLNYDHASGVIILPDEDGWLDEDYVESDEAEDYGGTNGLDRSITESMLSADESSSREATTGGSTMSTATSPLIGGGQRLSRYGTYFHHPERRRQVIPGAFPR